MQAKNKIKFALKKLGLQNGDTVLMHSDITLIVKYFNINWNEASQALKEAILEIIGTKGTLVIPTFNIDFCNKKKYIHEKTQSQCGFFTNFILFQEKSFRSFHPILSFCAIGRNASKLMNKVSKSSTGPNSVFDRLYKIDSKILLFNFEGNTFVNYIEQKKKVNYRFLKKFKGMVSRGNKQYIDEFDMYSRFLNLNVKPTTTRLNKYMIARKKMKSIKILKKKLLINLTSCKKMHDETLKILKTKPYFLLKKNPFI